MRFQQKLKTSIQWVSFAPKHGKGVVDGIGATFQARFRPLTLANRLRIICAKKSVAAAVIETLLMTKEDVECRNKYSEILSAKAVNKLSKNFHCTFEDNNTKTNPKKRTAIWEQDVVKFRAKVQRYIAFMLPKLKFSRHSLIIGFSEWLQFFQNFWHYL